MPPPNTTFLFVQVFTTKRWNLLDHDAPRRYWLQGGEAGLDLSVDLDEKGTLSVLGEVGAVRFDSDHSDQFHATLGGQWAVSEAFRLNMVGLKGLRATDDQWGAMFGIACKASIFLPLVRAAKSGC